MPRTRAAQDRHNELRRQSRDKARKANFISDYFQVKYPQIFKEVEGLFNLLDSRYEDKHDLRKTNEYLCFKQIVEGKDNKNGNELYFDLETATVRKRESLPAETATSESLPVETAMECESLPPELRMDTELNQIFDDIEFRREFDLLGEDLDLPELNSLEDELLRQKPVYIF